MDKRKRTEPELKGHSTALGEVTDRLKRLREDSDDRGIKRAVDTAIGELKSARRMVDALAKERASDGRTA